MMMMFITDYSCCVNEDEKKMKLNTVPTSTLYSCRCPWYKIDILLSRVTRRPTVRPGHAHLHQAQFWNR